MPSAGEALKDLVAALLGISAFAPPPAEYGPELGSATVDAAREALGGRLEPIPPVRLRWYPPDIERIQRQLQSGDLTLLGQLNESMKIDGVIRGLGDARTSVVNFPKRYYGATDIVRVLQSKNASDRDVYNEMIPASEARLMCWDEIDCGVAIGEMVPVQGRDFPVLVRRYVQNLLYLQQRNQWFYRSIAGMIPIYPGVPTAQGNWWVLHVGGGRLSPWNSGSWNALGRSYINKTQSIFARQAYEMKHAHPARVGTATLGATDADRKGLLSQLIRWALNSAFVLPVGYDLKLIESNGRGIEVYEQAIKHYNEEIATVLCGSAVMLQGTAGFSNMDVFRVVQTDLIKTTASNWDHTVNTQILPAFIAQRWGLDALDDATTVETDVSAPKDRKVEADTLVSVANAVKGLVEAIQSAQIAAGVKKPVALDVGEMLARFGIPTRASRVALQAPAAAAGGKQLALPIGQSEENSSPAAAPGTDEQAG